MRTIDEINADISTAMRRDDAVALREHALEMQSHGTQRAEAIAQNALGAASRLTGDFAQALEHCTRAVMLYEELGARDGLASATGHLGIVYERTGNFPAALEHYHRALSLYEELNMQRGIAAIVGNMGNVYSDMGEYPTALEYYRRSYAIYEALGDNIGVARSTHSIGNVYFHTDDYQAALEHLERSVAMFEALNIHSSWTLALTSLIATLLEMGAHDKAAELLERQSAKPFDEARSYGHYLASRAKLAECLSDFEAANDFLQQALALAKQANAQYDVAQLHRTLRELAQKRNDFAGYIEHSNEYNRVNDEILGKKAAQRIAMLDAERKAAIIEREREKERALLHGALPEAIAKRMLLGESVTGDHFDHAAVLFIDVVDFTSHTADMHPAEVVALLDGMFNTFDAICTTHDVIKIKTIGDSYMCFRGDADASTNALSVARVALDVMHAAFTWPNGETICFRAGIHIGPATAGVIGTQRLQYDVWGDTVNVASRMESTGEPGKIHVSETFASQLPTDPLTTVTLSLRGVIDVKGKGQLKTYWLVKE